VVSRGSRVADDTGGGEGESQGREAEISGRFEEGITRMNEKCCGTCKHWVFGEDDRHQWYMAKEDYDERGLATAVGYLGADGGLWTDPRFYCALWEARE